MLTENDSLIFDLNEDVFSCFPSYEGVTPGGYTKNFLGILTRAKYEDSSKEYLKIISNLRQERITYPDSSELILDWYPLLQSVITAKEKFSMVAIGAGWGRWISAGAFAAKYLSKDYFLIGVEAEPDHFHWMEEHMNDNDIDPKKYRLIHAAASNHCGYCWFYIGKPASWYGQSIVSEGMLKKPTSKKLMLEYFVLNIIGLLNVKSRITYNDETIQKTRCVDLKEVIGTVDHLDYMMLDIQGSEELFLTKYPEILQKTVKMVNVGTHTNTIENNLRKYFTDLGWTCTFDIPMNSTVRFNIKKEQGSVNPVKTKDISFGDGVQVWINPNL